MKSNDKFAHFICNFLIVVILGIIFSPVIGLAAALVASFSKETYDEFTEDGSGWDWKDVLIFLKNPTNYFNSICR
ncbi:hypothetical protein [Bacteroides stercoris]|nr:hypothetical protein [Bacteroides stercoris]